jgi:spore germination protein GerM
MVARVAAVAALIGAGLFLRTLDPPNLAGAVAWPWRSATVVTLYFGADGILFPLSRHMQDDADLPRRAMEALLAGPPAGGRLASLVPAGLRLRAMWIEDGVAEIDLTGAAVAFDASPAARAAIVATLTRLPGIEAVRLRLDGVTVIDRAVRQPLAYYASADGLVAVPLAAADPRAVVDAYLARAPAGRAVALPPDVRLLEYAFARADGLVSLRFAYTESLRVLAIERPAAIRSLLLGLIATLTELPGVRAAYLDFGGQSRLGLGQCSDLLRVRQPRPSLLNDERLL